MSSQVPSGGPRPGRFALVNALLNAIPGPLFTTVMDHLFSMGNREELTLKIQRGAVPAELEMLFDNSGPLPRLLDNDMLFTRKEAFKHGLANAPALARSFVRDPEPYRLVNHQAENLVDSLSNFDAMEDPVVVMNGDLVDAMGVPTRAYVVADCHLAVGPDSQGLVQPGVSRNMAFPVFGRQAMDPPADANHPSVPKYLTYVGNNVLLGAGSVHPLRRTVTSLWSVGERSVPLRVTVYDAHPSGRYFTRAADQAMTARKAGVDQDGVPLGYGEFVSRTLLPRDVDLNPDGAPVLGGVRRDHRNHWVELFPESTWLHDPPEPPNIHQLGNTRDRVLVADLVTHGRFLSYRTELNDTADGGHSGWYLIDAMDRDPPDVNHGSR